MQHVLFARFPDGETARSALEAVRGAGVDADTQVHEPAHGAVPLEASVVARTFAETDGRHGVLVGLSTGVLGGALVGGILSTAGILAPTLPVAVGFGALTGALVGVLMSGLFGIGLLDRRLSLLIEGLRSGEVIVTFTVADAAGERRLQRLLEEKGARVAGKRPV